MLTNVSRGQFYRFNLIDLFLHWFRNNRKPNGLYDDLDKHQLVELVLSYDEKLKALSSEVSELQKKLKAADEASREIEAASAASKSSAEKDKYKQLARRLKEERNNYRCGIFLQYYLHYNHLSHNFLTSNNM